MKGLTLRPSLPPLLWSRVYAFSAAYTVSETEQAIITQFGKPVGEPISDAGLHFKIPFIQDVNRVEKRILEWDGRPNEMPTKDKTYIVVDTFGRWRIHDAKQFFLRLTRRAQRQSRLDDILGSETRNAIAKHELIELVRTTKDREPSRDATIADSPGNIGVLYPIKMGRAKIEEEIYQKAAEKLRDFGIELLDVRFKRINYNESVQQRIYDRMISERQQIAERFRSRGCRRSRENHRQERKDLLEIESEAYKSIQEIHGAADAKATRNLRPSLQPKRGLSSFYEFIKTMETYKEMLDQDSTMILTTNSDIFQYLKSVEKPTRIRNAFRRSFLDLSRRRITIDGAAIRGASQEQAPRSDSPPTGASATDFSRR